MQARLHRFLALIALLTLSAVGLGCLTDVDASGGIVAEAETENETESEIGSETGSETGDTAEAEAEADPPPTKPRKERSTSVRVAPVLRGDLVLPVVAEGSIRARYTSAITFEIGGRVTKVWVREGQRVKKGQTLVSLDDREIRLSLEEARSRYLQGLGRLAVEEEGFASSEGAERVLDQRREDLAERERQGELSRDERLDRELEVGMVAVRKGAYRREMIEVRSGVAAARIDQARYEIQLERTVVKAPFAGVISGLELNEGEHVQVGQTVARLVDDINLEAAIGVLESDLAKVSVGKKAMLEIPALAAVSSESSLPVRVDVVDPEVAADSRTCRVLMRLRGDPRRIKPGMFVRASIAGQVLEDRLLVPRQAIVTRDGRPVLFKVEDGRAKWVYVTLGAQNETLVEIERVTQGGPLDPDTQVIVTNHLTMAHDAKVKVTGTVEPTDPWAPRS